MVAATSDLDPTSARLLSVQQGQLDHPAVHHWARRRYHLQHAAPRLIWDIGSIALTQLSFAPCQPVDLIGSKASFDAFRVSRWPAPVTPRRLRCACFGREGLYEFLGICQIALCGRKINVRCYRANIA